MPGAGRSQSAERSQGRAGSLLASLAEGLLETAFPTRCAGCDAPGTLVCPVCDHDLPRTDPLWACPRCGAPWGHLTCTECWETAFAFSAARAVGSLERPLSRMITLYKDGGERRLSDPLGAMLAAAAREWATWPRVVTPVPATDRAVRERGFDHVARLATVVARELEVPATPLLAAPRTRDLRSLGRAQRREEVAQAFASTPGAPPPRVLLVDDVLTTGATLDAAARVLLDAGAEEVRAVVLARAW